MTIAAVAILSASMYWIAASATQSIILRRWLRRARWWWVVVTVVGFAIAALSAFGTIRAVSYGFNLDVLQNTTHSLITLISGAIAFIVVLTIAQWLVLRQRVPLPAFWAVINVSFSAIAWLVLPLIPGIAPLVAVNPGLVAVVVIVAGVIVGAVMGKVIEAGCDRLQRN